MTRETQSYWYPFLKSVDGKNLTYAARVVSDLIQSVAMKVADFSPRNRDVEQGLSRLYEARCWFIEGLKDYTIFSDTFLLSSRLEKKVRIKANALPISTILIQRGFIEIGITKPEEMPFEGVRLFSKNGQLSVYVDPETNSSFHILKEDVLYGRGWVEPFDVITMYDYHGDVMNAVEDIGKELKWISGVCLTPKLK